jgi:PAS domain S-box-containing protein
MDGAPTIADLQRRLTQLEAENLALRAELQALHGANRTACEGKERLELAQRATGVGIFDWDMVCDVAYISPEWLRVYGLPENTGNLKQEDWLRLLHPEDRDSAAARAIEAARSGAPYEDEFRVIWPDDSVHWVHTGGRTLFDEHGRARRFLGTAVDLTRVKQVEQALRDAEDRMRLATEATGVGIWEWNVISNTIRWDAQMFQIYGITPTPDGLIPYNTWRSAVIPDDLPEQERILLETVRRLGHGSREFRISRPGESECRHIQAVETVRTDAKGRAEWVVGTNVDITARKQAAQALRQREAELRGITANLSRAKDAAENACNAKDQFLAVLSHELRTPLAPVRMAISTWEQQKDLLPPMFHQDLAMVRRNVDLECRLIDDMLDLNRITRGKLDLQFARVDLHEEARHAIQTVKTDAAGKQIVVSFDPDATQPVVVGDAARVQQVLWNLLKNAVKFTPPGGTVAMATRNTPDGHICLEVRDTGAGIEPHHMQRIFNAFEQGGPLVNRQFGGLGLGLTISKAIVEMHGGTLVSSSEGKGRGATFTLKLKVAAPTGPSAKDRQIANSAIGLSARRRNQLLRILLVEDHSDTAHIMKRLLGSFGYNVHTAGSVAEALAAAQAHFFDLVISDIGLPDGDGYGLMRQLIAQRPIKGIALTGYGMEDDVQQGIDAGFTAHLTKPISFEQLELTIRRVLEDGAAVHSED